MIIFSFDKNISFPVLALFMKFYDENKYNALQSLSSAFYLIITSIIKIIATVLAI